MRGPTEELTIAVTTNHPTRRRSSARAGRAVAAVGVILILAIACAWIPGVVGTAAAAILPWLGLVLLVLVALAVFVARRVLVVLLVPALLWVLAIAPSAPGFASSAAEGSSSITVVSQNVRAHSGGAADSAAELAASGADIVALTELDGDSLTAASETLAADYPHSYAVGTVALWSRFPLTDAQPLTLGLDWKRALRVVVDTPDAEVAVYVMHAASVRPGQQYDRDLMLSGIADAVATDAAESVVVVGDFNAASADPALGPIRAQLDWVRPTDGTLGLTWPAALPLARIDQVFVRGADVLGSTTTRVGESDHLATVTTLAVRPAKP